MGAEIPRSTVLAVGTMTARWARAAVRDGHGTVFTAAGLWPPAALLAGAADGPARAELEGALGVPAQDAAAAGSELLAALDGMTGVDAALGLWFRGDRIELRPEWAGQLPPGVRGLLTGDGAADRAALDAWAAGRTDGRIPAMPVELSEWTRLVLASALIVRTDWILPFDQEWAAPLRHGPWAGREVNELLHAHGRTDRLRVADTPLGPLTLYEVEGAYSIDVHLALGPEGAPGGEVAGAAVEAVAGAYGLTPGGELREGTRAPGVQVAYHASMDPEPRLVVRTVPFTVAGDHDLLAMPRLFGLESASDDSRGHFPGVTGSEPLAVTSAQQAATATFTAVGFRAAAVTASGVAAAGLPNREAKLVLVRYDRPFAFVAVHRASGLVLAAGWVAEPAEAAADTA
ncbi:hypothetical protein AA958_32240 [Streptomyces sp. CNQ-509]|uniref:serpin family protein n=1 Tax=Streptomyces sp. CNQ-509 TaxID=444103 RepID=UPI00062E09B9|nr:serpin family protein [Streptomyces sp. CNQ-509]AKH86120.1 hypothetical protein AA958_32240 [Streptomyces sp. CNQ-509]